MHHAYQAVGYVGDRIVSVHVQLTLTTASACLLLVEKWLAAVEAEMCHVDLRADMRSEDDLTPNQQDVIGMSVFMDTIQNKNQHKPC